MRYTEIVKYIDESEENLDTIELKLKKAEDGQFYVIKTKETFIYEDEVDADARVDGTRKDLGFAGVEKKYKQGKTNKAGEITKPETWTVVAKLNK